MKKKRGQLRYQTRASRTPLSRIEADYWLDMLAKTVKIGTEFEFNLPSAAAALENPGEAGASCVHADKPCFDDCANLETCLVERHPTFCLTRDTGKFLGKAFECPAENDQDVAACQGCPAWMLLCRERSCASYVPYCSICPTFTRVGEKHVENADIRRDAEAVRQEMRQLFQPSEFVGKVGKTGVLNVIKDNSLINNGGIEVPTVGRRVHWNSFYTMCKGIIDPIVARGGFVNERCGQHFHILAGYLKNRDGPLADSISELEEPMPEMILANMHQLHRRFELPMYWLMSGGESMEHLTRWSRFRQSIFRYGALQSRMPRIQRELAENLPSMHIKGKYASVAYHYCEFTKDSDVKTFHIENRIADGCLSPAAITAYAMLCYAIVLKATRLSQYGIVEVGDKAYCDKTKEITPYLINGHDRGWDGSRFADTAGIGPFIPWLQEQTGNMVQVLKAELLRLGPSFDILMQLAENPVSIRRIRGDSWETIEADLYPQGQAAPLPGKDQVAEGEIRELVDLAGIVDCDNLEIWTEEISAEIGRPTKEVEHIVRSMVESGRYRWSSAMGSLLTA